MTVPMQAMAAESVPEMELNRAVVTTVTAPSPLRNLPMSRPTKSTSFRASPVLSSSDPNRMNRGTDINRIVSIRL